MGIDDTPIGAPAGAKQRTERRSLTPLPGLAEEENFAGLATINRELIAKAEAIDSPERVVLDMDSTEIPVYGQQEQSAYKGHFESTCYHPLLLFDREGDCLAAKLRPGNVPSADDWEELLLPEIERQQK